MRRVVFLLEEHSMKVFLDELLPRTYPELDYLCVVHEGKNDLEKSIPRKLRGWRDPGSAFVVIRDNDGSDCLVVKSRLRELCASAGRPETVIRIACQELEAWYLGDPEALAEAFDDPRLAELSRRSRYRDPDAVTRPSAELARLVPAFQKVKGARAMGKHVDPHRCTSRSFQVFVAAVERLNSTLAVTKGSKDGNHES